MRSFLRQHRALALMLVLAALCMKAVVPTGFMIGTQSKTLTVLICDESFGNHAAKQIAVPMKPGSGKPASKGMNGDCPFASQGMAALPGIDPIQLALALLFILALGFAPVSVPQPRRLSHLRPPLRGPPALG